MITPDNDVPGTYTVPFQTTPNWPVSSRSILCIFWAHLVGNSPKCDSDSGFIIEEKSRDTISEGPGNEPGCPIGANPSGVGKGGNRGVKNSSSTSKGSANGNSIYGGGAIVKVAGPWSETSPLSD